MNIQKDGDVKRALLNYNAEGFYLTTFFKRVMERSISSVVIMWKIYDFNNFLENKVKLS